MELVLITYDTLENITDSICSENFKLAELIGG